MDLSIIIVNYRSWEPLRRCLASIYPLCELSSPAVEVIVLDNASDDGKLATFRDQFPCVTFSQNPTNGGFAYGCNAGAKLATGDELFFLNPDVEAKPAEIISTLALKREHPDVRILSICQLDAKGRRQKAFDQFPTLANALGPVRALLRTCLPGRHPDPRKIDAKLMDVDWVSGSALMIDRRAFDQLNGWDQRYWMYYEDVDLCKRAQGLGFKRCYSSELSIRHFHGGASRIDKRTRSLTRCEVIQSRHLYGHLHLSPVQAKLWHLLTFVSRSLPRIMLGALPFSAEERSYQRRVLCEYYGRAIRSGNWQSKRAPG